METINYTYDDINDGNIELVKILFNIVANEIKDICKNLRIRVYIWTIINNKLDNMINQPTPIENIRTAQLYLFDLFFAIRDILRQNLSNYNLGRTEFVDLDNMDVIFISNTTRLKCNKYFGPNFMGPINNCLL